MLSIEGKISQNMYKYIKQKFVIQVKKRLEFRRA